MYEFDREERLQSFSGVRDAMQLPSASFRFCGCVMHRLGDRLAAGTGSAEASLGRPSMPWPGPAVGRPGPTGKIRNEGAGKSEMRAGAFFHPLIR